MQRNQVLQSFYLGTSSNRFIHELQTKLLIMDQLKASLSSLILDSTKLLYNFESSILGYS
jgi:hypothetical protein